MTDPQNAVFTRPDVNRLAWKTLLKFFGFGAAVMKMLNVVMLDGSVWSVPLAAIARNRATYYAKHFGDDVERSLAEDTEPLFASDESEAIAWAEDEMNWSDVESLATNISPPIATKCHEGWVNGEKEIVEV